MIIHAQKIVTEQGIIDGYLKIEDGKITDVVRKDVEDQKADLDYEDRTIIPGIFDTHNHGFMGWNPDAGKEEVLNYAKALSSAAVTAIFPTVDNEHEAFKEVVAAVKENSDGARIMGIHSEGPYLNRVGEKGVDTGHPEIDLEHIQKMIYDAQGLLKLVAMGSAPRSSALR